MSLIQNPSMKSYLMILNSKKIDFKIILNHEMNFIKYFVEYFGSVNLYSVIFHIYPILYVILQKRKEVNRNKDHRATIKFQI